MVYVCEKFHNFLYSGKPIVKSDHHTLEQIHERTYTKLQPEYSDYSSDDKHTYV